LQSLKDQLRDEIKSATADRRRYLSEKESRLRWEREKFVSSMDPMKRQALFFVLAVLRPLYSLCPYTFDHLTSSLSLSFGCSDTESNYFGTDLKWRKN
jgi:hypothetical protein